MKRVGLRKPVLNAVAERWVQSVKQECLDLLIVFGDDHLQHRLKECLTYYNAERPHQSLGNLPLTGTTLPEWTGPLRASDIVFAQRLGGLLKSYRRRAAA